MHARISDAETLRLEDVTSGISLQSGTLRGHREDGRAAGAAEKNAVERHGCRDLDWLRDVRHSLVHRRRHYRVLNMIRRLRARSTSGSLQKPVHRLDLPVRTERKNIRSRCAFFAGSVRGNPAHEQSSLAVLYRAATLQVHVGHEALGSPRCAGQIVDAVEQAEAIADRDVGSRRSASIPATSSSSSDHDRNQASTASAAWALARSVTMTLAKNAARERTSLRSVPTGRSSR